MKKSKLYCQRRFSKKNVIKKLGVYSTRIFAGLVWCGVLWAFFVQDALPRQYVQYLQSKNPKPCIMSSLDIPTGDRDQYLSFLPSSWNDSIFNGQDYQVVAVDSQDSNDSYQVLLVRQSSMCRNILEFKGFKVLTPFDVSGSGEETTEVVTASLGTGSVDILSLIYPDKSSSLLSVPVGHFFALALLLAFSSILGVLAKWLLLPPLLGMILAGFLLRNLPVVDFARHISNTWSSTIRNIALVIVLSRGGLSMDFQQLKRLKLAVLLLAFLPCILEGALDGVVGTFWLRLPWQFAFTLGYVISSISPSVVVPTTLSLERKGYGKGSGINTLIVGAASMDVVISISLFGVFLGLAFSEGTLILDIFRAPIQIIIGLLYGVIFGLLLWVFPTKNFKTGSKTRNRFFLILGLGLFAYFGSSRAILGGSSLSGSGALAVLVLSFMAGQGWSKEEKKLVSRAFLILWQFFEPVLFALIGAAIDLRFISPSLVGQGIGLIVIGLSLRLVTSFVVVLGNGFSWLEMFFVSIAWIPKATVQAAIGQIVLDIAQERGREDEVEIGRQILTIAVLAIILTAPFGAVATSLLGPVLLRKSSEEDNLSDDGVSQHDDGSQHDDEVKVQPRENAKNDKLEHTDSKKSQPVDDNVVTIIDFPGKSFANSVHPQVSEENQVSEDDIIELRVVVSGLDPQPE